MSSFVIFWLISPSGDNVIYEQPFTVNLVGADPPPYGQPDRKTSVFMHSHANFKNSKNKVVVKIEFHEGTFEELNKNIISLSPFAHTGLILRAESFDKLVFEMLTCLLLLLSTVIVYYLQSGINICPISQFPSG